MVLAAVLAAHLPCKVRFLPETKPPTADCVAPWRGIALPADFLQVLDISDPSSIKLNIHDDPYCDTDGRAHAM
jgi:hypothetical protein